jgi:hypothetical protein
LMTVLPSPVTSVPPLITLIFSSFKSTLQSSP